MIYSNTVWLLFVSFFLSTCNFEKVSAANSYPDAEERKTLKLKTLEMFDHAYGSYKKYAHPADELMPLSCKGRYRGTETDRGDIDEALGNFSLTLIDTLDTLVVLGKIDEFETQVRFVIDNVKYDADLVVSVFETNIRVLGGLLGAHSVAVDLRTRGTAMLWYKDELLIRAADVGDRLLAAFNTTTGIPYPKVNLKYGINNPKSRVGHERDTCTACAGTMIMEFGALSRFTGNPIYEEKAHKAMDALWKYRSRHSDLVGTTINIHNGEWVRRDSGIGAGIDSYYEYCLKAYILLGDDSYLTKFNKHYDAINKYVKQGYMLLDVMMHQPDRRVRNSIDALQAFWPGLQVLKGDLKPAIETHEMLYKVSKKFKFLPESFTTNLDINWVQHPLRPEFVESTYFLYQATKDPYYLDVGKHVLESLEEFARVSCGFAALSDLRTYTHEDKMDSFVLAETFKYLYLLFSDESEHPINIHDYIFTTEAHLLPLYLSLIPSPSQANNTEEHMITEPAVVTLTMDKLMSCPNERFIHNDLRTFAETVRHQVNNADGRFEKPSCQTSHQVPDQVTQKILQTIKISPDRPRKLKAQDFVVTNDEHLAILKELGITLQKEENGKVQLIHQAVLATSPTDAEEGILFMQEMIQLAKSREGQDYQSRTITFMSSPYNGQFTLSAGSAQFGPDLAKIPPVSGELIETIPYRACNMINNADRLKDKIVVIERGDCMFIDKVRLAQSHGALAVIIIDHMSDTSAETSQAFGMSGDNNPDDVIIPAVFLFRKQGDQLKTIMVEESKQNNNVIVQIAVKENQDLKQEELSKKEEETKETPPSNKIHQEIKIDDQGGKTIITTREYVRKNSNGVMKRHIETKTKKCPTMQCDNGVTEEVHVVIEDIETKDIETKPVVNSEETLSAKGTIGTFQLKTDDSTKDEVLKDKTTDEKTSICTSAGCFKDLDELKSLSSVTQSVLKELRKLKDQLEEENTLKDDEVINEEEKLLNEKESGGL